MMTALSYCFVDRPMVALPVGVATEFASTNRMSDLVPGFSEAADHISAAWRVAKRRDFEQRLKNLGLESVQAASTLLHQLQVSTAALDELQQEQQATSRPWWANSLYSESQADRANDQAMLMFAKKDYSTAFELWTEAIMLCPGKSIHHCNRAAVALRLGQFAIAAEDARQAIKRDPASVKALLRAGRAHMGLHVPSKAAQMFQQAVQLDCTNTAAQRGLREALQAQQVGATPQQQQQKTLREQRAGISRQAVLSQSEAGERLWDAEAMLKAQPDLEAAKCCCVEALIACQRYKDAEARAELLTDGVDKLYLQAETLWRQGSLEAALACLLRAGQITPESSKCQELQNWLLSVQDKCYIIRLALEDGQAIACQEQCSGLLSEVQPEACSGLYAHILHQQAQAFLQRQQYKEALQSLKQAFVWEPNHHGCLLLQALVCREAGLYTDSFMALHKLSKADPARPDLLAQLQQGADLCLGTGVDNQTDRQDSLEPHIFIDEDSGWLATLGLRVTANVADVKSAYRRLAATWHPDKWVKNSKQEQLKANARFTEIAAAYRALCDKASPGRM